MRIQVPLIRERRRRVRSTSSATPTSRSRPRSSGSSPTRSTPGRLLPGARLAPVRELGAALRVNPNTIRAVYRRLADAGYVTSRHGAGTHVADRPPQRRGTEALAGIVVRDAPPGGAGRLHARRGRRGHVRGRLGAQAAGPAGPRPLRRVHQRRRRLRRRAAGRRVPRDDRGRGHAPRRAARAARPVPLRPRRDDDVPRRRGPGPGRPAASPVVAMLVGPGYVELVHEIAGLPNGSRVGLVCASERGADNIAETLSIAGNRGVEIVSALIAATERPRGDRPDRRPDPDVARGARRRAWTSRFSRPERIRPWTYEFDPAGLELLRRAIEHAASVRPVRGRPGLTRPAAPSRAPGPYDGRVMRDDRVLRDFHVRREPRDRYAVAGSLLGSRGDLIVTDIPGIRRLAARMNAERAAGAPFVSGGRDRRAGPAPRGGARAHHALRADRRPGAIAAALDGLEARLGPGRRPGCSTGSGRNSPGRGPGARAGARPPRGAGARPGRQREPGDRAAPASWSTTGRWRRDTRYREAIARAGGASSPTDRPSRRRRRCR